MQLTEIHQIRPNHKLYSICDELCFKSKNLYNAALFEFRQSFFDKELNTLTWQNINRIFNQSSQFDYRELPSKVSNTVLKKLGNNISSFWSLVKKSDYKQKVNLPKYLHKTEGRFIIEFNKQTFSNKRDDNNNLIICKSSLDLRIPTKVEKPQQVRIIPKVGCYVIEVVYEVEENRLKQNQRVAAIDLGLNNLATVVTNDGDNPILISGKKIKSINQYYNKMTSKKKSLLPYNVFTSKSLHRLWLKRNNKISYEIHKITKFLANYFDERDVSKVIIGNNSGWKNGINIGRRNNQNFVNIPHTKLFNQLLYKGALKGIEVIFTEESYTSKASFFDKDELPIYGQNDNHKFSGKRISRGLYKDSKGNLWNADLNGGGNIMRKVSEKAAYKGIRKTKELMKRPILITL